MIGTVNFDEIAFYYGNIALKALPCRISHFGGNPPPFDSQSQGRNLTKSLQETME
jgi:hypothetical protein